jgi:curved DNA-binding protein CbpA
MTADPFTVLGVPPDADDAAIRRRYLELTVQFTPEHHPAKFAAHRAAYEKIRTLDARAKYRLYDRGTEDTIEAIIEDAECLTSRPRPSLEQLLTAALPPEPKVVNRR